MPRKCSICIHKDRKEIDKVLLSGKSYRFLTVKYSLSRSALDRHKKHITQQILEAKKAEDISSGDYLLDQMLKINDNANKLLDTGMEATEEGGQKNSSLAVLAMREIRGQLLLQLDIFKVMKDMKGVKEFQEEVIDILDELSPKVKERFLERLKEKRGGF